MNNPAWALEGDILWEGAPEQGSGGPKLLSIIQPNPAPFQGMPGILGWIFLAAPSISKLEIVGSGASRPFGDHCHLHLVARATTIGAKNAKGGCPLVSDGRERWIHDQPAGKRHAS